MKKMLFIVLLAGLCLTAQSSFAAWQYCRQSVQTTTDSWNVYIIKTWTGGGIGTLPKAEYRFSYYDESHVIQTTPWAPIPSSGFIGVSGLGGGLFDVEVRELNRIDPSAPPLYQAFIGSC